MDFSSSLVCSVWLLGIAGINQGEAIILRFFILHKAPLLIKLQTPHQPAPLAPTLTPELKIVSVFLKSLFNLSYWVDLVFSRLSCDVLISVS